MAQPIYLAVDLLERRPSTAADVFSLALTVFEMVSGERLPGQGARWDELRASRAAPPGAPPTPELPFVPPPAACSPRMHQLVERMMSPVAGARPSATEVMLACGAAQTELAMELAMRGRNFGVHLPTPSGAW